MEDLFLYNTLTRKVEKFIPVDKDEVKMYSCGPTVYSYAHIGNFRAYIFSDTLRRVLKYNGYKVYGPDGCQITLEAAERIQRLIDLEPIPVDVLPSFDQYLASGKITYIGDDTIEAYYRAVWNLRVRPVYSE